MLGSCGIDSLLVEGGAGVLAAFFEAGAVNEALVYMAPKVIGGAGAFRVVLDCRAGPDRQQWDSPNRGDPVSYLIAAPRLETAVATVETVPTAVVRATDYPMAEMSTLCSIACEKGP